MALFENQWDEILRQDVESESFRHLQDFLQTEYAAGPVYPPQQDVFNALRYTDYGDVKAVILGQDPYHGEGQAHGLAFSVQRGVAVPPSLQNIYKELQSDIGFSIPSHGNLETWAKQGVLLLNTVLTVRAGQPNSHKGKGWERFTDSVIRHLNDRSRPMVFLLWGANSRSKLPLIRSMNHLALCAPHPSPLSAYSGFFGCKHFSKANAFLQRHGEAPVDWTIPE
ncbi:MAG: uracil-DNA glycosylase [Clostridia bacterium]|nr:uracil-DNA glycosylase [Clostridia bacterium]